MPRRSNRHGSDSEHGSAREGGEDNDGHEIDASDAVFDDDDDPD